MSISRREFLKLISLAPVLATKLPNTLGSFAQDVPDPNSPNILILVFDALSSFHSSLYGYRRETTPNFVRLAEKATVYHNHYAGGNFTSAGTASLLTGTYPWTHRAIHLHGTITDEMVSKNLFSQFANRGYTRIAYSHNLLVTSLLYQLREDIESLKWTRELCLVDDEFSDIIFPNDFNVAFWSEWLLLRGGEVPPASLALSLIHRFWRNQHKKKLIQKYGENFPRGIPNLHNLFFILEDATNWLKDLIVSTPRPYLAYVHVLPPHEPYTTRRDFIDRYNDGWSPMEKPVSFFTEGHNQQFLNKNRQEYDEYLAYADSEFGRLLDDLLSNGHLDNTILIVTSDHGEMFERGIRGHVTPTLYQPVIKIPLMISVPGQNHREDVYSNTSCVDLLPTLLYLSNQTIPEWCEGEILPPFVKRPNPSREVFSVEAKSNPKQAPLNKATISLIKGDYKLIYYRGYGKDIPEYELFDIGVDSEEQRNLISLNTEVTREMQAIVRAKLDNVNSRL